MKILRFTIVSVSISTILFHYRCTYFYFVPFKIDLFEVSLFHLHIFLGKDLLEVDEIL